MSGKRSEAEPTPGSSQESTEPPKKLARTSEDSDEEQKPESAEEESLGEILVKFTCQLEECLVELVGDDVSEARSFTEEELTTNQKLKEAFGVLITMAEQTCFQFSCEEKDIEVAISALLRFSKSVSIFAFRITRFLMFLCFCAV